MIKAYDYAITFVEFPDEIALCFNISNCPCLCEGCSENYLKENTGKEVTESFLDSVLLPYKNYGLTLIGFMGGDSDYETLKSLVDLIHTKYKLKVGFYSGRDFINLDLAGVVDYYKYGRFILPKGEEDTWLKQTCGPINFPNSNQKIYKREANKLIDITYRFRDKPISNLKKHIL